MAKKVFLLPSLCNQCWFSVGTGNIAGVATAIVLGGPGAVFWMWIIASIGAASAFVEAVLAQVYKVPDKDGGYRGGPAYYITKGLNQNG